MVKQLAEGVEVVVSARLLLCADVGTLWHETGCCGLGHVHSE